MAKKILVIDDEELIIKSLSRLLEKNGYEVFVAKNGQDALVITEEENFDLIVADIRMPGINGVDTVANILQKKGFKNKPVIFITGYADEEYKRNAQKLKPVAYIYKPFDIQELVGKVRGVLKEKKLP